MSDTKFYICKHCGNIVGKIHDAGVPLMCCGQEMTELVPGTVEASTEKHIPVVTVEGNRGPFIQRLIGLYKTVQK